MYPGISAFRDDYVLPTAQEYGSLHLGLGCYIATDDPGGDIRTLANACSQYWSILTLLTISKLHQAIDEAGLQDDIIVTSTIYDSIYFEVTDDIETVKWLNDNLIPIMLQPYLTTEIVHNTADLEIGKNWADLHLIKNDASLTDIQQVREELDKE